MPSVSTNVAVYSGKDVFINGTKLNEVLGKHIENPWGKFVTKLKKRCTW